jgi:hypothetical protein
MNVIEGTRYDILCYDKLHCPHLLLSVAACWNTVFVLESQLVVSSYIPTPSVSQAILLLCEHQAAPEFREAAQDMQTASSQYGCVGYGGCAVTGMG